MSSFTIVDYLLFIASLVLCAAIGVYYLWEESVDKKKAKKAVEEKKQQQALLGEFPDHRDEDAANEYFMGDKSMHLVPMICSMFASYYSSITLLGLPAEIYTTGSVMFIGSITYIFSCIISAYIYIPMYYKSKVSTIFEVSFYF